MEDDTLNVKNEFPYLAWLGAPIVAICSVVSTCLTGVAFYRLQDLPTWVIYLAFPTAFGIIVAWVKSCKIISSPFFQEPNIYSLLGFISAFSYFVSCIGFYHSESKTMHGFITSFLILSFVSLDCYLNTRLGEVEPRTMWTMYVPKFFLYCLFFQASVACDSAIEGYPYYDNELESHYVGADPRPATAAFAVVATILYSISMFSCFLQITRTKLIAARSE